MKTILVPVDYSDTAKNAAVYALALAQQIHAKQIILYNAFQPPMPIDAMSATVDGNYNTLGLYDVDNMAESNRLHLEKLRQELTAGYSGPVEVSCISEFNMLRDGVEAICQDAEVHLVVMGISEAGGFAEAFAGSTSLEVARHICTPVIIVPHNASYHPVKQILFTCDYNNVLDTVPVDFIKQLVTVSDAQLFVLHVNTDSSGGEEKMLQAQQTALQQTLQDIPVHYRTIDYHSFIDAVNIFAVQHNIDLVVAIPKRHSFFERLFLASHTKALAFHTDIPLLLVHTTPL